MATTTTNPIQRALFHGEVFFSMRRSMLCPEMLGRLADWFCWILLIVATLDSCNDAGLRYFRISITRVGIEFVVVYAITAPSM